MTLTKKSSYKRQGDLGASHRGDLGLAFSVTPSYPQGLLWPFMPIQTPTSFPRPFDRVYIGVARRFWRSYLRLVGYPVLTTAAVLGRRKGKTNRTCR